MSRPTSLALALLIPLLASCHDQVADAPDPVVGSPIENLLGCAELQAATLTADDGVLTTGAEAAGCASDGLRCPLDEHEDVAGNCEPPKRAIARCELDRWVLTCAVVDPGTGEAGAPGAGGTSSAGGQGGATAALPAAGAAG